MIKNCSICGKEFECYDRPKTSSGLRSITKKRSNAKTCSKECLREFIAKYRKEYLREYMKGYYQRRKEAKK